MARPMKSANTTQARPQPLARQEAGPWRRTLADWTVTIVVYLFVTTCVVQGYVIPTSSMEDTLLIGDHVLVDKLSYAPPDPWLGALLPYQQIERGDVIVFRYPLDLSETLVKRVVAIAGDRLRIDDKQVVLNGRPIPEPYKVHKTAYIDSYRDNFPSEPNTALPARALEMLRGHVRAGEIVVPPDSYFAMGDNRDLSSDSRYWGFVPRENIIGKPLLVYWSYDAPTEHLMTPLSFEHVTDVALHFFTRTRWERSFTRVEAYREP